LAEARRERDQAEHERDQTVAELERADGRYEHLPPALHSALTERDAFRKQRDQAYGEIDDLCQERNELKGQLERLRKQGRSLDRDYPQPS
jgi:chromosome segregation ATPase